MGFLGSLKALLAHKSPMFHGFNLDHSLRLVNAPTATYRRFMVWENARWFFPGRIHSPPGFHPPLWNFGFFTAFKLWNRLLALAKCTLCGWFTRLVWDTKTQLRKRKPFGPFSRSRSFVRNWKPSARKCAFQGCFLLQSYPSLAGKQKSSFLTRKGAENWHNYFLLCRA